MKKVKVNVFMDFDDDYIYKDGNSHFNKTYTMKLENHNDLKEKILLLLKQDLSKENFKEFKKTHFNFLNIIKNRLDYYQNDEIENTLNNSNDLSITGTSNYEFKILISSENLKLENEKSKKKLKIR